MGIPNPVAKCRWNVQSER